MNALAPYLQPPADGGSISVSEWKLVKDELPFPLTSVQEGWEYRSRIKIQRELEFDGPGLARECGFGKLSLVRLCLDWSCPHASRTTSGRFRVGGPGFKQISCVRKLPIVLNLELPSEQFSHMVLVRTVVALGSAASPCPLSPIKPGSVLWSDEARLQLEGTSPRMPTAMADFSRNPARFQDQDAPWSVWLAPGALERPVSAGVIVYLNSRRKGLIPLDVEKVGDDVRATMLKWDVARQLIERALSDDGFVDSSKTYDKGTLGATMRNLVQTLFSPMELPQVAALRTNERESYEDILAGRLTSSGRGRRRG